MQTLDSSSILEDSQNVPSDFSSQLCPTEVQVDQARLEKQVDHDLR